MRRAYLSLEGVPPVEARLYLIISADYRTFTKRLRLKGRVSNVRVDNLVCTFEIETRKGDIDRVKPRRWSNEDQQARIAGGEFIPSWEEHTIPDWGVGQSYGDGDVVDYQGTLYEANTQHIASVGNNPSEPDTPGVAGIPGFTNPWSVVTTAAWAAATDYAAGDIVSFGGTYYISTGAHTSHADNDPTHPLVPAVPDTPAFDSPWAVFTTSNVWADGTDYTALDVVDYNGTLYRATADHTSTERLRPDMVSAPAVPGTPAFDSPWVIQNTAWAAAEDYAIGDIRVYSGTAYRAKSVHTSAAANRPDVVDREAVPAYTTPWGAVTVAAWAVSTVYAVGDYAEFNSVIYRVITAHTSADDNDPLDPDRPAVDAIPAYVSPWEEVTLPAWSNSSMYAVGARVSYLGVSYICITDHTATTGNNPAVPSSSGGVAQLATPWEQDATVNAFDPDAAYLQAARVTYAGGVYLASAMIAATETWLPDSPDRAAVTEFDSPWTSAASTAYTVGTDYTVGQLVTYLGGVYQCREAHTAVAARNPASAEVSTLPWTGLALTKGSAAASLQLALLNMAAETGNSFVNALALDVATGDSGGLTLDDANQIVYILVSSTSRRDSRLYSYSISSGTLTLIQTTAL